MRPTSTSPTPRRRRSPTCARRSTTSPAAGFSAGVDPDFPAQPVRLRLLHAGRADRRHAAGVRHAGQTRTRARATPDASTASFARVSRLRVAGEKHDGPEQVLVNDCVPAVPVPRRAAASSSARTATCTCPAATARAGRSSTTASSAHPTNPCGDPPGPRRRPDVTRRPRRAGACAPRTCAPAATRSASTGSLIRIDPATGEGVPGNPMFASAEPERAPHARARLPQPGATRDPAGHERRLGGGPRRRLLGGARPGADPTDPVRNFGWPCYEGGLDANGVPYTRIRPAQRRPGPRHLRGPVRRAAPRPRRRTGATTTSCPSCQGEDCDARRHRGADRQPDRRRQLLSGAPARSRPPTTTRCSSPIGCATACGRCCRPRRRARSAGR